MINQTLSIRSRDGSLANQQSRWFEFAIDLFHNDVKREKWNWHGNWLARRFWQANQTPCNIVNSHWRHETANKDGESCLVTVSWRNPAQIHRTFKSFFDKNILYLPSSIQHYSCEIEREEGMEKNASKKKWKRYGKLFKAVFVSLHSHRRRSKSV